MSKQNCRTGYAAVYFREYWFQRLSCALQRNLAAFYKFNFALFCGEIRYDFERNRSLANWKYRDVLYKVWSGFMFFMIFGLVRPF